jgi:hypothetical protein
MVNETSRDFEPDGIRNYLEPGRHYVSYTVNDASTVAKHYLVDAEARKTIAAEGRRAILASHTWMHRAAQILQDIALPVLSTSSPSETGPLAARLQSALDELPLQQTRFRRLSLTSILPRK